MKMFEVGDKVNTEIVAITKSYIFLNLNAKSEGIIDIKEFSDEDGTVQVKVGDTVQAFFLQGANGEMIFTTRLKGGRTDVAMLENAYRQGIPVEGVVEKEIKGGFSVKIGGTNAFCPFSQMGYKQREEPSFFVGKHLSFRIQTFKEEGRNILVSNRAIMEEAEADSLATLATELKVGDKVSGKVLSLHAFGAFVEVKGLQMLLPISEVSRARVTDLSSVLKVGETIAAVLLALDWKGQRFSVSMKSLESDPWSAVEEKYPIGTTVCGKIVKSMPFGVFVSLDKGVEALLHVSAMGLESPNENFNKKFPVGQELDVVIKSVSAKERKIGLSIAAIDEGELDAISYMKNQEEEETYNPFAALLKK